MKLYPNFFELALCLFTKYNNFLGVSLILAKIYLILTPQHKNSLTWLALMCTLILVFNFVSLAMTFSKIGLVLILFILLQIGVWKGIRGLEVSEINNKFIINF
jgi:hypothetical protein